ncbi:MAG: ABC transporter ATP-binding protein [Patescibacteria group bacterium]
MIRFEDATIILGRKRSRAVIAKNFTMRIRRGDFTCILGPSGCGKTTLLNVIANFQLQTRGEVLIDDVSVSESKHRLGYVFQGHNIFPWKTVRQNIAFGLSSLNMDEQDKNRRVNAIAAEVELSDHLDSYPDTLSGGMKQRVGLARALVGNPAIILMDEPFASLDALTAIRSRELLKRLSKKHSSTVVFVTHNIEEAIELGDRILVVSKRPMKVLIDKKIPTTMGADSQSGIALKNEIFDALKLNMDV